MTEWDYITKRAKEGAALEFDVDGEATTMSVGDYLSAVSHSSAQKAKEKERRDLAAAKSKSETQKTLLYLAAGGAALLLLTR